MPATPLERLDSAVRRIADYVDRHPRRGVSHDDADETVGTIDVRRAAELSLLALSG